MLNSQLIVEFGTKTSLATENRFLVIYGFIDFAECKRLKRFLNLTLKLASLVRNYA